MPPIRKNSENYESQKEEIVAITNVTDLIGSYTCLEFMKKDGVIVRAVVHSEEHENQIRWLKVAFGDNFQYLRIVKADYLDYKSLARAFKRCKYVIHTASDGNQRD